MHGQITAWFAQAVPLAREIGVLIEEAVDFVRTGIRKVRIVVRKVSDAVAGVDIYQFTIGRLTTASAVTAAARPPRRPRARARAPLGLRSLLPTHPASVAALRRARFAALTRRQARAGAPVLLRPVAPPASARCWCAAPAVS
jgi:hypothetical protein